MKMLIRSILGLTLLATTPLMAAPITDSLGDIDPTIANGGGTLDIVSLEVSQGLSDLVFQLTVNGDISTTDWGNFMIGIATGNSAGTTTGNGWVRPINLDSPVGGMNYFVGSWVNSGGGSQVWSYNGVSWGNTGAANSFAFTPGAQSVITYTIGFSQLGLTGTETIYFDAYSSGGGGGDSAVDALSNPNVSITTWSQTYTSSSGSGISSYTIVPEPSAIAMLGLGALVIGRVMRRRK